MFHVKNMLVLYCVYVFAKVENNHIQYTNMTTDFTLQHILSKWE